ncbi:hypothetical protein [Bradyrhizobium tunisiense]|uniref:hypothetical protein n=1 Tax=Bradyrhizobium tunisiense TaxID=3278709 RepID=UPI0035E0A066
MSGFSGSAAGAPATATASVTVSTGSGSLTSASGSVKYQLQGKRVSFQITVDITTNGTGATNIGVSGLPWTFAHDCVGSGARDPRGKAIQFYGQASASAVSIWNYDNTYPGATGARLIVCGDAAVN